MIKEYICNEPYKYKYFYKYKHVKQLKLII